MCPVKGCFRVGLRFSLGLGLGPGQALVMLGVRGLGMHFINVSPYKDR